MIIEQFGNDHFDNRLVITYQDGVFNRVDKIARNYIRRSYKLLRKTHGLSQKEARAIIWNVAFSFHLSEPTTKFEPVERYDGN